MVTAAIVSDLAHGSYPFHHRVGSVHWEEVEPALGLNSRRSIADWLIAGYPPRCPGPVPWECLPVPCSGSAHPPETKDMSIMHYTM